MADAKARILAQIVPDEVIDLARALVKIPRYTADETPVAEFLHRFMRWEGPGGTSTPPTAIVVDT